MTDRLALAHAVIARCSKAGRLDALADPSMAWWVTLVGGRDRRRGRLPGLLGLTDVPRRPPAALEKRVKPKGRVPLMAEAAVVVHVGM